MLPQELEAAVGVWRAANIARGAPHGAERTDRIRAKLSAPDALAFVALRSEIVGMALAEPGRFDDGEGELDSALLHISMVFVHPTAQEPGSVARSSSMCSTRPARWATSGRVSGPTAITL